MSDLRRRLSAASWVIVAAVLIRAASGGGGGGFLYVAAVEPRASYATGAVILGVAVVLAIGFGLSPSVLLARVSAMLSVLVALYAGWWYLLDDHTSGLVLGAAAVSAFGLAAPALRRDFIDRHGRPKPPQDTNQAPGDR
jgi:hypothetical protein